MLWVSVRIGTVQTSQLSTFHFDCFAEVDMTPYPAVTFRTIGGIIDLYVYAGPTAADVVKQHWAVIGQPAMPPYWALGFHLSRWGYENHLDLQNVIDRNIEAGMPYDVQWFDIETLLNKQVWTFSPIDFARLPAIVENLHSSRKRVVSVVVSYALVLFDFE